MDVHPTKNVSIGIDPYPSGAVLNRQGIGGAGSQSAMSEDFGVYGSDPRSKVPSYLVPR